MCDTLQNKIFESQTPISTKLFDNLVTTLTESQSWGKINLLVAQCDYSNCDPSPRIISYLKKNLVYCFDTGTRAALKNTIDEFEIKFFSNDGRELRKQFKENERARLEIKKLAASTEDMQFAGDQAQP